MKCSSDHKQVLGDVNVAADAKKFTLLNEGSKTVVVDKNDNKVLLIYPNFLANDLEQETENFRMFLKQYGKLPAIKTTSPRHISMGSASGQVVLGAIYERGGINCNTSSDTQNSTLTKSENVDGCNHSTATEVLYRRTQNLSRMVSAMLKAWDKDVWNSYQEVVGLARDIQTIQPLLVCEQEVFLCRCLLVNVLSKPHRDLMDYRNGYAIVVSLGVYTRSYICFPSLKLRILILPGTLIIFPSYYLEHYMMEYEGSERYTYVFFMRQEHFKT
ncbi:1 TM domain-containing transmembrane protein [Acrasis kona]|uniref:1 TM domain-containing transmembrane protein n=1 Tax=Acrasis kona TaxID=1008807 RepID=A0AAW2ZSJ4_9EUKA